MNYRSTAAKSLLAVATVAAISTAYAQDEGIEEEQVIVTGIRASLESALQEKRESNNLVEVIQAVDIGKLPDQNLAEVLENVTGIQITRTAGVGTGVQIRGTNSNRVEINGVSTVASGAGRSGIDFEDVNASIIAAVEVTKASEAKTIEGSVGGTVNLKTIRPLDLKEPLGSIRVQGEQNSLSVDGGWLPRISGAYGNNWETDSGVFGWVISGSYTEQEAVSFRPRADRDNLGGPDDDFLGIQFLLQEQENDDYQTNNIATTFEWAPNDDLKFHFDVILNDQERSRDQYRLQASGVSSLIETSIPDEFETVNFGSLGGQDLGSIEAALIGELEPDATQSFDNPNLRFTSETGSRVTDSKIFVLGGDWENDRWSASFEVASSSSDTTNPTLNTTLNFINPNTPLAARVTIDDDPTDDVDGVNEFYFLNDDQRARALAGDDESVATELTAGASVPGDVSAVLIFNDNAVPFAYDLSGQTLSFGINANSPVAPTAQQLLDPANVVLDQVQVGRNRTENQEDAIRFDFSYDLADSGVTSLDFGYRFNESSSKFQDIGDDLGGFTAIGDSPNGLLFEELLVAGPDNYGDADGRELFISDFLLVDPDRAFSDPDGVLSILEAAIAAHDPDSPDVLNIQSDENAFYDVNEETNALYVQANFEAGIFRGNFGLRYIDTTVDSTAFGPEDTDGNRSLQTTSGGYDFILPRINLVAQASEDVVVRLGYGTDIRRPDFDDLNTGFTYDTNENTVLELGNPGLEPEEVDSFDISAEWYFAPSAVASIGYFRKERTNIFGTFTEAAAVFDDPTTPSGQARETDPSCPGGGAFNPEVIPNVLGDPATTGLCVDVSTPSNDSETTTQSGIELAFQYDLSSFEDSIGWASGFGVLANYTNQDFSGGSAVDTTSGRGLNVLGEVTADRGLLDFSENAYNITLFYEKYGLSARMRYTWRDAFRTEDFAGGASLNSTLSFPVVTHDRGQLNASVNYDITEKLNVGIEAVNLTESKVIQSCVNEGALLCFVGNPDRRITAGVSYKF